MDFYPFLLSLHLVAVVSWFAGLFYLGRLFIYHAEALAKPEPDRSVLVTQFTLMQRRVWRAIVSPAAGATFLFGIWLAVVTGAWRLPWFHVKIALLVLLTAYHALSNRYRLELEAGKARSVRFYRLWNEAATVLLFTIVFTAIFKRAAGAGWGLLAVAVLTAVGMGVFLAKKRRG